MSVVSSSSSDSQKARRKRRTDLLDQQVMVTEGRHRGRTGRVVDGRNGYYEVQLNNVMHTVMKRRDALALLSESAVAPLGPATPRKRHRSGKELIGKKIVINKGRADHIGLCGTVLSAGNGFYRIRVGADVIKKRGDEMEVMDSELCEAAKLLAEMKVAMDTDDDFNSDDDDAMSTDSCEETPSRKSSLESEIDFNFNMLSYANDLKNMEMMPQPAVQ